MKMNLLVMSAVLFGASLANAGTTMCANSEIYSSEMRSDGGAPPRPGQKIGSYLLVYMGSPLVKKDITYGYGKYRNDAYTLEIDEKGGTTLDSSGNPEAGMRTFKTTAKLVKNDSVNPSKSTVVTTEDVICQTSWNHLMP